MYMTVKGQTEQPQGSVRERTGVQVSSVSSSEQSGWLPPRKEKTYLEKGRAGTRVLLTARATLKFSALRGSEACLSTLLSYRCRGESWWTQAWWGWALGHKAFVLDESEV